MKKLVIILIGIISFALSACDKETFGDSYGLTGESLPPYVEISDKNDIEASQGSSVEVALGVRTVMQVPVTIQYTISGAFSSSGTVTLPKEAFSVKAVVAIPQNVLTGGQASKAATFKITGAKAGNVDLTIGHKGADEEVVSIMVVQ